MDTFAIIKRIELRLAELGMSKADFYNGSGISSASYSQWNNGKYNPSETKLRAAANCLGVSYEYLRYGKLPSAPDSVNYTTFASSVNNQIERRDSVMLDVTALLNAAQVYLRMNSQKMTEQLIAEGIQIENAADYQKLKDGLITRKGVRDAVQRICEKYNLDAALMERLGFSTKEEAPSISDEAMEVALAYMSSSPAIQSSVRKLLDLDYSEIRMAARGNRVEKLGGVPDQDEIEKAISETPSET